ncbi:MAG: hypothetical protein ACLVHH_03495 [Faecalibacillus intestinalis]|uniref:hypothetical protein n=1 Tax=Faecalibacillus intestinalis TaxID=1982626 RepID=UPI00399B8E15
MQPISKVIDGRRVIVRSQNYLLLQETRKLKTAIIYGADAAFIAVKNSSLRSQASNFYRRY